jgi:GTPase
MAVTEGGPGTLVDEARIRTRAGSGGRGVVSFRHEPYVPRGGPDGGDGGRGGSVVLFADPNISSLRDLSRRSLWQAENGMPGQSVLRRGRQGQDLRLAAPVGTLIFDDRSGELLGDLDRATAEVVVARGGAGGRGNAHFKSPVHRTPRIAEAGLPGEDIWLRLELKIIADVGLIGPPNAGKSSLLAALTAARPQVGSYPFTTLDPQLGVAVLDNDLRLVLADIPGLIEGASKGTGLGHRFLRHVERTRALVYLVDGSAPDPWRDLQVVREEIQAYSPDLALRPSLIAINKLDLPEVQELRASREWPEAHWISALSGEGVPALLPAIAALVKQAPSPVMQQVVRPTRLRRARERPTVTRQPWGFEVTGGAVEQLVQRTNFDSDEGLNRFQLQLERRGVSAALLEAGVEPGDTVRICGREFEYQP